MKDTATVKVDRYVKNAKYKKYLTRSKKYLAHDPGNTVKVGDTVTIVATRPISKLKSFAIDPTKTVSADDGDRGDTLEQGVTSVDKDRGDTSKRGVTSAK